MNLSIGVRYHASSIPPGPPFRELRRHLLAKSSIDFAPPHARTSHGLESPMKRCYPRRQRPNETVRAAGERAADGPPTANSQSAGTSGSSTQRRWLRPDVAMRAKLAPPQHGGGGLWQVDVIRAA